jgi:hypothetical protein
MSTERIGLKLFDPLEMIDADRFRRDLMLVDKLAIDDGQIELVRRAAGSLSFLHGKDPDDALKHFDEDLKRLDKLGLICGMTLKDVELPEDIQRTVDTIELNARRKLEKGLHVIKAADGSSTVIDPVASYALNKLRADLLRARRLAITQSTLDKHLVPFATGKMASLFERSEGDARVLRVVLSSLPTPSPDTHWDDLIAFKSNPTTQLKLAQLRSWMTDMAVSSFDERQIQAKLEAALAEYRAHMQFCRIKTQMSCVEVLVVTTAEIVESMVRLKFGEGAKRLFQIFKENHALMEAELKSPGREVAFIDAASAQFPT